MLEDYADSALRHSADADALTKAHRFQGAGYLIGFAVECAIKCAIVATQPKAEAPQVHLPELVERAKKKLQGRQKHEMFKVIERAGFMRDWTIGIRYAADGAVKEDRLRDWRADANRALAAASLKRRS